jgi:hypothetical protein
MADNIIPMQTQAVNSNAQEAQKSLDNKNMEYNKPNYKPLDKAPNLPNTIIVEDANGNKKTLNKVTMDGGNEVTKVTYSSQKPLKETKGVWNKVATTVGNVIGMTEIDNTVDGIKYIDENSNLYVVPVSPQPGSIVKLYKPSGKDVLKQPINYKIPLVVTQSSGGKNKTDATSTETKTLDTSISELPDQYKSLRMAMINKKAAPVDVGKLKGHQGFLEKMTEGAIKAIGQSVADGAESYVGKKEFDNKILPELETTYGTQFARRMKDGQVDPNYTKAIGNLQYAGSEALSPQEANTIQMLMKQDEIRKELMAEQTENQIKLMMKRIGLQSASPSKQAQVGLLISQGLQEWTAAQAKK